MNVQIPQPFTDADLARLRAATDAIIATPGDEHYLDEVSTWNSAVCLRPAVVVGARTPDDAIAAVGWAGQLGLPVGVNATGHGAVANADGAVLITTRRMSQVSVDPATRTAVVAAGARMGDLTAAAAVHGLACVQGSTGSVSAAGFILGGGLGVLSRTLGLAADHVRSLDVVTADGRLRTVDAEHEPDLFWALRGGKGNFGVVTAFRIDLVELTSLFGGGIFFDGSDAATVLHSYRRWIAEHTELTSSSVALLHLPPDPAIPEPIRGRFVVHVRIAHVGDTAEGARLAHVIRAAAPALLDTVGELTIAALDAIHQDPSGPLPTHERGCLLEDLPAAAIDAVLDHVVGPHNPFMMVEIRHLGAAIARAPRSPSAVPGRTAPFALFAISPDIPPLADVGPRAVQDLFDSIRPWRAESTLPNFLGRSTDPASVRSAFPAQVRTRLLEIKRAWDPLNMFRLGHALVPASSESPSQRGTAPLDPVPT